MNGCKNNFALAHPYHDLTSCSKFTKIPLSGLKGNSMIDGGIHNIPITFFNKTWE